jgi:hypothetical protein
MPPAGFEATIPAGERPWTHVLGRAVTAIGHHIAYKFQILPSPIDFLQGNVF